jgi:hypothetical protein
MLKEIPEKFVVLFVNYGTQVTEKGPTIFSPVSGLINFKRPFFCIRCKLDRASLAMEQWKELIIFKTI